MKIAVAGKGGAGKTTVAAVVARTLAAAGHDVIAVDADPNPNLTLALGVDAKLRAGMDGIVNRFLADRHHHDSDDAAHGDDAHGDGQGHAHDHGDHFDLDAVVAQMAVTGPDGVTVVETGRVRRPAEGCLCCGSHATTRRVFTELDAQDRVLVADLEAGVNDLIWARPGPDDTLVVVTEPSLKAIEVAARLLGVAGELHVGRIVVVVNQTTDPGDTDRVRQRLGDVPVVAVPDDQQVRRADRDGVSPADLDDAPAVAVLRDLAGRLVAAPVAGA